MTGSRDGSARKLIIIGLDGATFDVLEPWMRAGKLPGFARLVREGASGLLRSTTPPVTGPAWTSFMTGVSPGQHGVFDFVKRVEGRISRRVITCRDFRAPTVWRYLTAAKKTVGLANIPITYPPPRVDGFAIPGMLTPVTEGEYARPEGLMRELNDAIGGYIHDVLWVHYARDGLSGAERFIDDLMRCLEKRIEAFFHLMNERPTDVFMGVFTETDRLQHFLWEFIHPARPLDSREQALAAKVEAFYRRLDGFFVELMARIEGRADLLVVSDHGFGPLEGTVYINRWLEKKGYLAVRWGRVRMINLKRAVFRVVRALLGVRDLNEIRRRLGMRPKSRAILYSFFDDCIDWSRTTAYSSSGSEQGIYVNLRGREPEGTVEAGADYERVRASLLADLEDLRDPRSRRRLPMLLARREDLYQGPHRDDAPDIAAFVDQGRHVLDIKLSRRILERSNWVSGKGSHRYDGVLMGWGPSFAPGAKIEGAGIVDMTPAILHHQGLPIPEYMDGKVPEGLFGEEHRRAHPVERSADGRLAPEGEDEAPLSSEDAARVEARLRGLGYM